MNNQINASRQILWFTPLIGPSLSNLFQKGIGEQDIVGINQLVETCSNNINIGDQNENTKYKISRSEHWKLFTDDLKKYSDIKIAIKERQDGLEKIQKEVNELNKQKQDVSNNLQILISFINAINNKISYYKGFMDHHHKDISDKINLASRSLTTPIIIIDLLHNYSQTAFMTESSSFTCFLYAFIREVIQKTPTFQIVYRLTYKNLMIFSIKR